MAKPRDGAVPPPRCVAHRGRRTARVAGVNGDRLADIIRLTQGATGDVDVALSTRVFFGQSQAWPGWLALSNVGDLDGDARADIVTLRPQ